MQLSDLTKSPVLIAGIAGVAGVAGLYIYSRNRPASEVVGGQLPISWDALANWLSGHEGGPGGGPNPPGPLPIPIPIPYPPCQSQGCPPGQVCTAVGCVPIPDPSPEPGPIPIPHPGGCGGPGERPCPNPDPNPSIYCQVGYHWNGTTCVRDFGGPTEGADHGVEDIPDMPAIGGGTERALPTGLSKQALYDYAYNLRYAHISANVSEARSEGGH